ncbi:putative inner membrane protein [Salmonella enterica subsp. houtenae]|nr:putative inner membrane protein [Salmonella enterica subsp. houtenae]
MFTSRQRSGAKTKVKSIYGKCSSAQGYCASAAIGAVFSHHDCGLFVDSTAFYFGVCMGRYDCYRDLARFAEITKNMVGAKLYAGWHSLLDMGGSAIMAKVRPYIGTTTTWFVGQAAHIGRFMMHCALMLLFSALLYWRGEQVAMGIRHFACRLAAKRGDAAVLLAAQAIRAVALGVVVTALVQAVLGGVGLAISGVPYATLLTVVMILSCLVQLGPLPVLIPAIIWLYWTGDTTWGTVLLVWSAVVGTLDNVIRPVLIRMGADLPLLLILSGVIGGLIAFGMIGLFIGPVLLAVTWRLFSAWVHEVPAPTNEPEEILEELDEIEEANKQS